MRRLRLIFAVAVAAAFLQQPERLAAQDVAARLDGRVAPAVIRAVEEIALEAAARDLPIEPLVQKAIEGGAKGVPSDRVIAAVRALAGRLGDARNALRAGGITTPSPDAIEGGADALNAGLDAEQVRDLGRLSTPPHDPVITLRVAATLTALGVPPQQGIRLMEHRIQAGRGPSALLDLPTEVQVDMAQGATAEQAAGGLERGENVQGAEGEQGPQGGAAQPGDEGGSQHEP